MGLGHGWQVAGAAVVWRRKSSHPVSRDWEGSSRRSGARWAGGWGAHRVREVGAVACGRRREWRVEGAEVWSPEARSHRFRESIGTE